MPKVVQNIFKTKEKLTTKESKIEFNSSLIAKEKRN